MITSRVAPCILGLGLLLLASFATAAGKGKARPADKPAAAAPEGAAAAPPSGRSPLEQTQEDDALSLQEKQFFAKLYEELDYPQKAANEACGIQLVAEYEKASTRPNMNNPRETTAGLSTYARAQCVGIVNAIERICVDGGDVARRAVQRAKLRRVICKVAPKGPLSVTVSGGVVTGVVDLDKGGGAMQELATSVIKKKI